MLLCLAAVACQRNDYASTVTGEIDVNESSGNQKKLSIIVPDGRTEPASRFTLRGFDDTLNPDSNTNTFIRILSARAENNESATIRNDDFLFLAQKCPPSSTCQNESVAYGTI